MLITEPTLLDRRRAYHEGGACMCGVIDPILAFNVGCEIHMVDFVRRRRSGINIITRLPTVGHSKIAAAPRATERLENRVASIKSCVFWTEICF